MTSSPELINQALQRALICRQSNQVQEAKELYQHIIHLQPDHPEANFSLGLILLQEQQAAKSLPYFETALDHQPDHGPYWLAYINALISAGKPDVARQTLEMARQAGLAGPEADILSTRLNTADKQRQAPRRPDPDALLSFYNQGNFTGCERLALHILDGFPDDGLTWKILGAALQQQNRSEEAIFAMRQAVRLLPQDTAALNNLGLTLKNTGELQESETILRQAITLCDHFAEAHNNLGVTLLAQGRLTEAETHLRRALQLEPAYTEAHCNLGLTLKDQGKIAEALASLENAVRLNPSHAEAHNNLGNILQRLGRLTEAECHLRRALAAKPDFAVAWNTLAFILHHQGRLTESQSCYEKALSLKPDYAAAFDGLLFVSNYHADASNEDLFQLYRQYDKQFGIPLQSQWQPHTNNHDTRRRLKIGYVSPAFYSHPVLHFLEPLLANHDKGNFEIFAYAEKTKEDQSTQTYRQYVDHWIETSGLSDDELAAKIRDDEIDVLIDLAGHTNCNRLLVFARKPAPVSLHWLDFGYTTGLSAIDYYLTDIDNAPLGSEHLFSEQLWRLPAPAYVYRPAPDMGEVSMLPAQTRGYVTFGTLTRAIRINHRTLRVWSAILHRVKDSRLIIDSGNFKDQATQDAMKAQFAAHGIDPDRLLIGYHSPPWDVLRNMDISLDCFPHNSGTTLFESLYMGVPFITLAHRPALGRLGCSVLQGAGHPEWIATSEEEYIDKAVALAADLPRLAAIRAGLRQELEKSPLMDEPGFARMVEEAYRQMFRKWSATTSGDPSLATNGAVTSYNLAISHQTDNRLPEAKTAYLAALNLHPGFVETANNLGVVFQQEKRYIDAEACLLRTLALKPDYTDAWYNLGNTYKLQSILLKAEEAYRKALQLKPDHVNALYNLGNNLQEQGRLDEAEVCLRQTLAIAPNHLHAFSTLLYTLNYHPDKGPDEIFQAYQEFNNRFFLSYQTAWKPHTNTPLKNRRLRVAYIAPDYRNHPARYFLVPLLAHHDRSMLEIYAYIECSSDRAAGELFSEFSEHWIATQGMTDDQLSERIRHDAIDVLIDLAGHTAHNRLGVFARKPAPVSLHWLDYAYTTGLSAIDYYLADPASLPDGCEPYFSEKPWRITTPALAYRPPEETGPVNALPANQNGCITFGTLTRAIRVNHRTIRVWAEILKKCPKSRLIINSGSYREPGMQEALASRFAEHGIDGHRLNIGCTSPPWDVLRSMDISLDCFPHNSGTTLFESLYMGVPFITLADRPSMGRLGSSILEGAGHPEWIAASEEEYIAKAVALAADLSRLAAIRANLRPEMAHSPLMDEAGFTRRMESAWREMFQRWQEMQSSMIQDDKPSPLLPPKKKKSNKKKSGKKPATPAPPTADINRLLQLFQRGAHVEAVQLARQLTSRYPRHGTGWKILGPLLHQQGLKTEAIEAMTHAVQYLPDDPDTHFNLGIALEQAGRLAEAEDQYRQTIQRNPRHLQALYNLGNILKGRQELIEAENCYQHILQDQPRAVEVLGNLGNVQRALGRLDAAAGTYRQGLQIRPDSAELLNNLGLTLRTLGAFSEAETVCRQALSLTPGLPEAHNNLGLVYQDQGRLTEAAACFQQALQSNPQYAVAWHNLGNTRVKQGRLDEGESCLRKAIELQPQNPCIYSDLLFLLNNHPDKGSEEIYNDYKIFNTRFGLPLQGQWRPFANLPGGKRRLKIGYVSSNFSRHSTRYFLEPLLARHNRKAFEIFLYTDQTREDEVTARYRSYADHWRQCTGKSDDALAQAIRSDAIDILVDLAGHTGGNRLGVFARKPAPVSLHWLDFGYTTGLTAIDYYLTDGATVPVGSDELFSETPWRLKTPALVYRPEETMGEVSTLPALENGFIRFGTLTRALRINHRTIRVWSEILRRLPNAHLVIDSSNFKDESARTTLIAQFTAKGIDPARLDIGFHSPPWDLLRGMDIGLDCFPHNSGTTLFENLYMGVPFVTLADRPCIGRLGSAILEGLGHPEWIARTEQEYVEIAVKLASDPLKLALLRAGLRQEMRASALMDEPAFAAKVEDAYQEMFERWQRQGAQVSVAAPAPGAPSATGSQPATTKSLQPEQKTETPATHDIDNLLALYHQGNLAEAANLARALLKEYPRHGFTWKVLGTTLQQLGQSAAALPALQRALELLPNDADCHNTYGVALFKEGRHSEAEHEISKALQLNPGYAEAYLNLGDILQQNSRFPEAESHYRKSISLKPGSAEAHCNLGKSLFEQGRAAEAEASFRQAIQLRPDFAEAHNGLGNALMARGAKAEAERCYRQSIRHRPNFAEAHNNLGIILQKQGAYAEAEGCFRQALQIKPDYAAGHSNLGNLLKEAGRLAEAEASYRQALRLQPDSPAMYGNLLFLLNNDPDRSAEAIYAEYARFNELFGLPHQQEWRAFANDCRQDRRLKIGYVSSYFSKHSTRHFLEPLLACHDKEEVEVFLYSDLYHDDEVTLRYRSYADQWRNTYGMSDTALCDRIYADGIDILVDLAGHTGGNRLGVFARKPAPVSLHWLDFGYTTGLTAIDYYLTDEATVPAGSEGLFSETPWRIDTPALVYRPAEGMGEAGELPALRQGHVTFGTLTRALRINHRTIRVWSEILRRVPQSHLVIDSSNFRDTASQQTLAEQFLRRGVGPDQLEIGCHSPPWDLLRRTDIGFDCFPHNSGTTLIESLYMGSPFITLAERPSIGRLGAAILEGVGHREWIAYSEEEYIDKAVNLAADLPRLAAIRAGLRREMEQSPLMDEPGFARRVEKAYREMFSRWCEERQ